MVATAVEAAAVVAVDSEAALSAVVAVDSAEAVEAVDIVIVMMVASEVDVVVVDSAAVVEVAAEAVAATTATKRAILLVNAPRVVMTVDPVVTTIAIRQDKKMLLGISNDQYWYLLQFPRSISAKPQCFVSIIINV